MTVQALAAIASGIYLGGSEASKDAPAPQPPVEKKTSVRQSPSVAHADKRQKPISADIKPIFNARYRLEAVDQEGFNRNAVAHTLSTRFGFEWTPASALSFLVEGEGIANLNDRFNSTTNGRTEFPVVADPDELELNRAQLTFTAIPKTTVTIGRQIINQDDQRFLGAVAFRQNTQTFDAVRAVHKLNDRLRLDYSYIDRVHRIFGDGNANGNFDSNSHVAHARYKTKTGGALTAFAYLLDFEQAPGLSSATVGARYYDAVKLTGNLAVEFGGGYARQWDYGENLQNYALSYGHAKAGLKVKNIKVGAEYERLGGDGTAAFMTPLATLHKFQGFADVFLKTPASGVQDLRFTAVHTAKNVGPFTSTKILAAYHTFTAARGGGDLGDEVDFVATAKFGGRYTAALKGAFYNGPSAGPVDRTRIFLSLTYSL